MNNITKAAQDALDRMDALINPANKLLAIPSHSATQLAAFADMATIRAALQDKAGEVRDARFWLEAIVDIWSDGDKAPEHRCYVEGAFSDAMREASALLAAQPAPVAPDVARYRAIRNGLVYIEPHESSEIYVAGETGVYTKSGDEFDAAIDAIAASQQKG